MRLPTDFQPNKKGGRIATVAIYSPHLGGNTGGSFRRAHNNMWNNVKLIQEGKRPNFVVNGL